MKMSNPMPLLPTKKPSKSLSINKIQVNDRIGECTVTTSQQERKIEEKPQILIYKLGQTNSEPSSSNGVPKLVKNLLPTVKESQIRPVISNSTLKKLCAKCGAEKTGTTCLNCPINSPQSIKRPIDPPENIVSKKIAISSNDLTSFTNSQPSHHNYKLDQVDCFTISDDEEELRHHLNITYQKEPSIMLPRQQHQPSNPIEASTEMDSDINLTTNNGTTTTNSSVGPTVNSNPLFTSENEPHWYDKDDDSDESLEEGEINANKSNTVKPKDKLLDEDEMMESEEEEEEEEEDEEEQPKTINDHPPEILFCRSIRIGSYKLTISYPHTIPVMFYEGGITLPVVPLSDSASKVVLLHIKKPDLTNVLIHSGTQMPIVSLTTTAASTKFIKDNLGLNKDGPFYDPASQDEIHKRIVLVPVKITPAIRNIIITLFSKIISEGDSRIANKILVTSTHNNQDWVKRLSFDSMKEIIALLTSSKRLQEASQKPIVNLLTYPPPPQTSGITITSIDIECLLEGEFLNDVIMDFYLKFLFIDKVPSNLQSKFHFFNTFFYTHMMRLKVNWPESNDKALVQSMRHDSVKKWTRHVNIFDKDYIIVPVCQASHWFLVIICFPGEVEDPPAAPKESSKEPTEENGLEDTNEEKAPEPESTASVTESTSQETNKPCILIMDSMKTGPSREIVGENLRGYLTEEWRVKKKTPKTFNEENLPLCQPWVPQQNNSYDCGVYVLQYVETFLEDPTKRFIDSDLCLKDWFPAEKVENKRKEIKELINKLQGQED